MDHQDVIADIQYARTSIGVVMHINTDPQGVSQQQLLYDSCYGYVPDIVTVVQHILFYELNNVVLALLIYEYIITFHSEVALFWRSRSISGVVVLFLLNRYLTLTVQILAWLPVPPALQVSLTATYTLKRCLML